MTETAVIEDAARLLREAARTRVPIQPLTRSFPALDVADAWRIQEINRDLRVAAGRRVIGYKVGLTSVAMQQQMGVDEPDFGVLLDDMRLHDEMTAADFVSPRVEAEIAMVLDTTVGAGASAADVLAATAYVQAAIEIIDSRIADWKLSLVDTVADNASSGAFVAGEPVPLAHLDLAAVPCRLLVNGVERASGVGAAALGHPATAAAWLANRLGGFGQSLTAGSVVLTGSLHASLPVAPGDEVRAIFDGLGECRLRVR